MTERKLPVALADLRQVQDVQFTVGGMVETPSPYAFQRIGAGAIVFVPKMVLADEMGLGKTLQYLMALAKLRQMGEVQRSLLITTRTLLHQWVSEAEKWFPGFFRPIVIEGERAHRYKRYDEVTRNDQHPWLHRDLVILTYSTARVDWERIVQMPYDMVGMDEASAIKNPATEQTKACYRICQAEQVQRVVAITATPIQSRLEEYQSIMYAVDPLVLGSRPSFEREFCNVERFNVRKGTKMVRVERIASYKNLEVFKDRIREHVLQRSIDDVGAQMPELIIQDRWLDLTPGQAKRYDEIASGLLALDGYDPENKLIAIQQITRLSQVVNSTALVFPEAESCKINEIDDLLRNELKGQPIVIFSKYVEMLELVRTSVIEKLKIPYGMIVGGQDSQFTELTRQRFQKGELQVILMSTAGEVGMNLGNGKYVICCDVLYNEGRMRQLYARIRRLSSVHPQAIIIRLLAKGTLEERAIQMLEKRAALIDYIDDPSQLTDAELKKVMEMINRDVSLLKDDK